MHSLFNGLYMILVYVIVCNIVDAGNKTTLRILLKRNNAYFPGEKRGYYLAVADSPNKALLIIDIIRGYVPFAADWFYDDQRRSLTHCDSNLQLTTSRKDWSLGLEENGNENQEFIYNQSSNELFWQNPITTKLHVIYIRCSTIFDTSLRGQNRGFVAANDMDMISEFDQILKIKQKQRSWMTSTAFSFSRYNQTHDLSSETVQNWLGLIKSFAHINETFGLFRTKKGGYLIGDGYVLTIADADKFEESSACYKYYGLWKEGQEKGHLIHYLSGNYVPYLDNFKFFVLR